MLHQPAEGSLDHPALGQHLKAADIVRSLDDFDLKLFAPMPRPLGEVLACITSVGPKLAQPGQPRQKIPKQILASGPFGLAGGLHQYSQDQGVHQ